MIQYESEEHPNIDHSAERGENPAEPVHYTFDKRIFVVRPVFKKEPAGTISNALLRLMRADLETS